MKRLLNLLLVVLTIVFYPYGMPTGAETIRVAQHEIPPMASKRFPEGGLYIRMAKEVFALHDIELIVKWYPMKRAFRMVETGNAELSFGWSNIPKRQKSFFFSDKPMAEAMIGFYYRKDKTFDWKTFDDLKGLRIGDSIGSKAGGKEYLAAEKLGTLTVERVSTEAQNIQKLLAGRIDIML